MHCGHLRAPWPRRCGRCRRVAPAGSRLSPYHSMHPHSRNTSTHPPRGPGMPSRSHRSSGPRAYPREAHRARPRSRRDPGASGAGCPSDRLSWPPPPRPAQSLPPGGSGSSTARRHRGARGVSAGALSSSSAALPLTRRLRAPVRGSGTRVRAPGSPRLPPAPPSARGPLPGRLLVARPSEARGNAEAAASVAPGGGGGALLRPALMRALPRRGFSPAARRAGRFVPPPRCVTARRAPEPSPSPPPPAGPRRHLPDARRGGARCCCAVPRPSNLSGRWPAPAPSCRRLA